MKLGAHMSTQGGVWRAIERATSIGADSCQIFVKNNMQWFARAHTAVDIARFHQALANNPGLAVFGHTGYLINLAAPPSPNRDKSIESLTQELQRAHALRLPFLVLHPGAHLGAGEETGLDRAAEALDIVFAATRGYPVRIALENTAGQGSCLGHRIAHLAALYDRVAEPRRLGLCLDTAHCFAAGYDLRTPAGWKKTLKEVQTSIGLDQILAFHLNDSATPLGSRVDRHAGIGQGKLGRAAFRHIVNDPRFRNHPACLETPKSEDLHEDVENLSILHSLR
ncbi:MAG TPA: deoxyribonuclease IV [Verrucomicrobiota bacterium]|nr:deoxyribonuclease IV [Verrucomicrobiota bacterium]HNU51558.1 deoxyribonuclease IV [Verrucomicrobiota bacterium]